MWRGNLESVLLVNSIRRAQCLLCRLNIARRSSVEERRKERPVEEWNRGEAWSVWRKDMVIVEGARHAFLYVRVVREVGKQRSGRFNVVARRRVLAAIEEWISTKAITKNVV